MVLCLWVEYLSSYHVMDGKKNIRQNNPAKITFFFMDIVIYICFLLFVCNSYLLTVSSAAHGQRHHIPQTVKFLF